MNKKNIGKAILLFIGGLLLILIIWAFVEPSTYDREEYVVNLPNLDPSWYGRKVAVIADFQVGMWLDNVGTIRRIIDNIVEESPDIVVILGDFIYHGGERAPKRIQTAAGLVKPLTDAGLPVFAVLGNHDYSVSEYNPAKINYQRADNLTSALEKFGVTVLKNESVLVDGHLYIVGIGAHMIRNDIPEQAFAGVPDDAPRLVLMHNPTTLGKISAGKAPLSFAGHTHGGQIRLPGTPHWSMMTFFKEEEVHADGWIEDYGARGNRLYVNRGIGMSIMPIRINCPPELTVLTFGEEQGE
ncbi:MAG: metallophosphoesterase [Spirochaetia bacterium]